REIRHSLGLRENSCVVGYFGRLEPEKGMEDLCRAIDTLDTDFGAEELEFLVVGNGSMEAELQKFFAAKRNLRVVYRNAIPHDHVGRTLASIDIHVLPSRTAKNWKEQFGRILIEAMACGVAVIGSDSGEIPHLIRRSEAGLIFPEGNSKELARCIGQL